MTARKLSGPTGAPNCIECGEVATLCTGADLYPHRPGLHKKSFYRCQCGAYCGCHPGTTQALGFPCGAATRKARSEAHAAFDPLWKSGQMSRSGAYKWLAAAIGIDRKDCHIGMMSRERALAVVAAVSARTRAAA
jgi:hypothetical protein